MIPKGKYIPTSGTGVVRYDYKGIEGLQLSANYNFGQRHDEMGNPLKTKKGALDANGNQTYVADPTGNLKMHMV